MRVSQKWQYALRALFELSKRHGNGPTKVAEIAEIQGIPPRFLEVILNQLKRFGFVESRRGAEGGYMLARPPHGLTVGQIIRAMDGEEKAKRPESSDSQDVGAEKQVIMGMWDRAWEAMWDVYDQTTFQQLIDDAKRLDENYVPSFSI